MDSQSHTLPPLRQKSHLKLSSDSRHSQGLSGPPVPSGASFLPLGVPIALWEGAKKKFFQQGGLTTSEAVCQFLSAITLADMLPHNVKDWLETLAVREGQILMHQLEEHHLLTAANATYYRTPRGSMKHTKSSFGSKKLLSFKHHSNQEDGAPRQTPRGAASRMTPRRQSLQNTPLDDSFGSLAQVQSLVVDEGPTRKSATLGRPRLQLDLNNVHLLEQTLVNVLPVRLVNKIPPSPAAAGVQQLAASSPTFDPVKECGSFSLEQLGLLLSFFALPDIDAASKGGEDVAAQKGNVFSFLEEMSPEAFLPSLMDGEVVHGGVGHEVDLMEASSRPGSPSHTFVCPPGSVASNVEILLQSFGMSPHKIFASGNGAMTKALTQEDHEASYKSTIELLLASSNLRGAKNSGGVTARGRDDDDDEFDVLLRLTPPESRSHSADHSHHHHHHHSKSHLSSMHRSRSAMETLPPISNTFQSLKIKAPTSAGLIEVQGEWVSSPAGDPSPDSGFSGQSTARSMSSANMPANTVLVKARSNVSVAPSTTLAKVDSVLKHTADVPIPPTASDPTKKSVSVSAATQTECMSFTMMWLGPIRRNIGTTTRPTGDVGKVVSLTMVKVEKRRKERQEQRVRGALATLDNDPRALVSRTSGKPPPTLTAADYSCMSIEQMKQLYNKSAVSTRPSLRALKQQTKLAREAEAALKIKHTLESGEFDDDSLGATMIV